eukprot:1157348-Pelagomonas_calceolata.AAC.1
MKAVKIKNGNTFQKKHLTTIPGNSLENQNLFLILSPFNPRLQKRNHKEASKETGCTLRSLIKVHSINA